LAAPHNLKYLKHFGRLGLAQAGSPLDGSPFPAFLALVHPVLAGDLEQPRSLYIVCVAIIDLMLTCNGPANEDPRSSRTNSGEEEAR
jgi:hypothetical protein